MKTKTKKASIISFILFTLILLVYGINLNNQNITNAAPPAFSPSSTVYSVKCIKDSFGNYTGSGYVDVIFNTDPDASYKRRYILDRPGKFSIPGYILGLKNAKACPGFVPPPESSNPCIGLGGWYYSSWVQYNSIDELTISINSNGDIERLNNSDYKVYGNNIVVSGFSGSGFTNKPNATYSAGSYTFTNSLVELEIELGNSALNSGRVRLYQTPNGSVTKEKIEELIFTNVEKNGLPHYNIYPPHNFGAPGPDQYIGHRGEFFFTGSLFAGLAPGSIQTSGTGDLILERRMFRRTEKGYRYTSTNYYDFYNPTKGDGSINEGYYSGGTYYGSAVNLCDTESTVDFSGGLSGHRCPGDVNKAYYMGTKNSVELKLKRNKIYCTKVHYNTPGAIISSTTPLSLPTPPSSSFSDTPIPPPTNSFSFSGSYKPDGTYSGATINGGGFDYLGRMIVEATDGEYNIEGIKYFNEFNTGGTVKKIVGQLIVDGKIIGDSSTPTSVLPYGLGTHSFSDKVQDRNFNIKTKLRGDYKFNLQFFDKTSSGDLIQVGNDVEFPLTIIPTNEMRVEGLGVVSYPGGAYPYSNADQKNDNTDVAKICYNITDNFSNPIGYDSVGLSNGYQVISGTGYNSLRTPDFGNYQTGHGNNIKGVAVNFSSDFNSHLLSSGSVYNNKGIALDQRSGEPYVEAIEIKDQPGIGNSGPYDTGPGYSYTGPGDDKHLVTFRGSRACFNIQSYAPANKRLRFKLTLPTHNRDYDITPDGGVKTLSQALTNYVRFEKPFSGDFVIDNDTEFKAGTEQTMRIDVKKNNSRCPSSICSDDFTITNYLSSLTSTNGYYSVIRKDNEINTIGTVLPPVFPLPSTDPWMVPSPINRTKLDFVLNYISLDKISDHPSYGIKTEPFITNEVNGKDVIYRLNTSAGGDNSWMEETKSVFYGLDADGVIEGDAPISNNANYTITGQQSAFTSLDKLEMRKQIKSNAYNLIRGRSSGSNVSGVLYYDGNYTISSAPAGVNTLIIKNGNLFITGDIATNLGIIVIKDNLADKTVGNVYITPNVTEINAIIYADGSLLSKSNSGFYTHNGTISGNPEDSPTRTNELQNDLILIGSLFSRNTIGGAIGAGPFKCPGGKTCSSFDEAVKYDLNYIRRGPNGFKVEYNPANQINPPKGFEK